MVDFYNYIAASLLILQKVIPYGNIEFFAPPWTVPFLFPFAIIPPPYNAGLWQFGSITAVTVCALLAIPKSRVYPLLALLAPPTLLMLAVGQVSAFVALADTCLLLEAAGRRRLGVLWICLLMASSKPHLLAVPALIMVLTLAQKKDYRNLLLMFSGFAALAIGFELLIPSITREWIISMFSGSYSYGAPQQLQVTLSNGAIFQIGASYYHAPSPLISLPLLILFILVWYREGLTPRMIALSLCICFLLLPYYRLYDLVILYYPIGIVAVQLRSVRNRYVSRNSLRMAFRQFTLAFMA